LKTCPQCRFWQPPEASSCQMCGASFDEPVVDPLAPTWDDPSVAAADALAAEAAGSTATGRATAGAARRPSSRARRLAMAGTVAGVLIVALAGFTWYQNRPPELHWTTRTSPLGLASIKEAGSCRSFSPSADDDVAVAGRLCDLGSGRSLAVIEFDFRSRDLSKVEPRFLAESLMQGTDGLQTGALDTYTPTTSPLGTAADLTGRAIVSNQQVKTVGRIIEHGNRGLLLLGAAADAGDVTAAFHTMAESVALAAPTAS
jgi:hypothetical protein